MIFMHNKVWGLLLQDIVTLCHVLISPQNLKFLLRYLALLLHLSTFICIAVWVGYSWNEGKAGEKWEESPILMFSCGIQFAELTGKKWVYWGWGEEMILGVLLLWRRTEVRDGFLVTLWCFQFKRDIKGRTIAEALGTLYGTRLMQFSDVPGR